MATRIQTYLEEFLLGMTHPKHAAVDRAEAQELLALLAENRTRFARPKKRHVRIKRVRKPREPFIA